jgi:hypothetical protein
MVVAFCSDGKLRHAIILRRLNCCWNVQMWKKVMWRRLCRWRQLWMPSRQFNPYRRIRIHMSVLIVRKGWNRPCWWPVGPAISQPSKLYVRTTQTLIGGSSHTTASTVSAWPPFTTTYVTVYLLRSFIHSFKKYLIFLNRHIVVLGKRLLDTKFSTL